MKDFDLQLFAEEKEEGGDTSTSNTDEKSNESESKKEDDLTTIKSTILELSKEIAGIKEFLTSPDFLSSVKSDEDEGDEESAKKSAGSDADAEEKKLVTKIADQVASLIKRSEVERQIKKAKEVHSDFDDYKEQMIVISNASPDLSVEEVYQKAKKLKSFLEEDKKKTKTTPSFKPDTNTTATSDKIPVTDIRGIVVETAKKLGLNL